MNLAKSGRIIIIDNDLEAEALPIMKALAKYKAPFIYFSGDHADLPSEPYKGIRYVFLDIELIPGTTDNMIPTTCFSVLDSVVAKDNGPYVIIFWSKHVEHIDKILSYCESENKRPIAYIDLEKSECIVGGKCDLEIIERKLQSKLAKLGAFTVFSQWENMVNDSSMEFINRIIPDEEDWSGVSSRLFHHLYRSYVGKNVRSDSAEQFKIACELLNISFLDELSSNAKSIKLPSGFKLQNSPIDLNQICNLNSSLFYDFRSAEIDSGTAFKRVDNKLRDSLGSNIFKESMKPEDFYPCDIVITPMCDIAQNKVFQNSSNKLHRIISGIVVTMPDDDLVNFRKRIKSSADSSFLLHPFNLNGNKSVVIIHFATLSCKYDNEISGTHLFTIKNELLFDLQSKVSNHVNRLGNYQM